MPTYSYRCTECDTAFDIQQAFTDNTLTECPTCGGKLRKVFSSIGVTFSGSGFYSNDSRSDSKRSLERSSQTSDKKSEKTAGGAEKKTGEKSAPAPAKESASSAAKTTSGRASSAAPAAKSS
ncbi:MAG: FmdB family transcriptional regulator [Ramlibacter sp.]|nr:FmdB family transcriptional regulator [Cryobacterium sp.]